jgi:hypothetical protein
LRVVAGADRAPAPKPAAKAAKARKARPLAATR